MRPLGSPDPTDRAPGDPRVDYDMPHRQAWGFDLALYLLFKGISTGAMFLSALLWFMGDRSSLVGLGGPIVSLVFASATAIVLVIDLERPERFYYILTRPNWSSWLARGAFLLTAHAGSRRCGCALYWFGWTFALVWLAPVAMAAAFGATAYTGFLFAQGLARDLWQGPHGTIDLIAQAAAEGSAAMLLVARSPAADPATIRPLALTLAFAALAHLGILLLEHVLHAEPDARPRAGGARHSPAARTRGSSGSARSVSAAWRRSLLVWLAAASAFSLAAPRAGRGRRARRRICVGIHLGRSGTVGAEFVEPSVGRKSAYFV